MHRIAIQFDENRLMPALVGAHDVNLLVLQDRLGLSDIEAHGNVIAVSGTEQACENTRVVLEIAYRRLANGQDLGTSDLEGICRHVLTHAHEAPADDVAQPHAGDGETGPASPRRRRPPPNPGQISTRKRTINARTPAQSAYITALQRSDLVFGVGPAGTGKTYLAVAHGAARLERGEVERLILSRPAVEAGERLGFLPGDMKDKVDPYLRPLYDALFDVLGSDKTQKAIDQGYIEIAPLAFMRGRTLAEAVVILDEAQNCTVMQMKMFLTRLGEHAQMIVTGDPTQIDLPRGQESGLMDAVHRLNGLDEIEAMHFSQDDVVRRKLVGDIVKAYDAGPPARTI